MGEEKRKKPRRLCFVLPADLDDIFAGFLASSDQKEVQPPAKQRKSRFLPLLRRSLHRFCTLNWAALWHNLPCPNPRHFLEEPADENGSKRKEGRQEQAKGEEAFHDTAGIVFSGKVCQENPRIFSYAELYVGTSGFSKDELLGSGGFGRVYRAVLPSDGTLVAVKCVAEKGERFLKTFAAELVAVAQLRHRNLVRLRGWCVEADELLLVYDYMPNRSLDRLIFPRQAASLDWARRERVLSGLAAALFYLHDQLETQIIHRDVKTSNVMLDADYNARLGDFGLARWLEHELETTQTLSSSLSSSSSSHHWQFRLSNTSKIGGTIGYLPPESFRKKNMSTAKSDVFSFGIVVLEVLSGRRAVDLAFPDDQIMLLDWVRRLHDARSSVEAVDDRITKDASYSVAEAKRLIHLGLLCSLNDPRARPPMKWVVDALSSNSAAELPPLPSFNSVAPYVSLSSSSSNGTTTTATINTTTSSSSGSTVYLTASDASFASPDSNPWQPTSIPAVDTPREISYKELIAATGDFAEANMVAELDFGTAYHGVLENNVRVLIKRLGMKTCPALRARFASELTNIGRLRHRYLVQLRGWCTDQGEMLVVYDYLAHGRSLSKFLFHPGNFVLPWRQRYAIVKALASAVLYLHEEWEEQVIHKSITSSSIFLDSDLNPRLGAFALAEFLARNAHGHSIGGNSDSVRGIFGYISPEYMATGAASTKTDIYSFGVVLLEIACGRMAVDFRRPDVLLVKKVHEPDAREALLRLADSRLDGQYDAKEVARMLKLGIVCTGFDPQERPSMRQIVSILDGNDRFLHSMMKACKEETKEAWDARNASSLAIVKRIQALGIH
ncbi:receptor like protein kinase S.2 [Nymphaea colorata]|uniref:Protein kinase domain-containing protein n=1 Tax=Nymphaea colorata TaxID=210225 RepID=A0A5K1B986_9MAGN|nr:receptor like protein kinase S.2 [Nymphaea colorata]